MRRCPKTPKTARRLNIIQRSKQEEDFKSLSQELKLSQGSKSPNCRHRGSSTYTASGAWKMDQEENGYPQKNEDTSSDPQHPWKEPVWVDPVYNPRARKAEMVGSLDLKKCCLSPDRDHSSKEHFLLASQRNAYS